MKNSDSRFADIVSAADTIESKLKLIERLNEMEGEIVAAKAQKEKKKPLIFLGPTLKREVAVAHLDADYHPPIRRGDLPNAIRDGYRIIGIIDGVFFQDLTVSVQEIRQALAFGVRIFGSSSMGALRAAEAYTLGMIGVGKIYEWYRSEQIEADDEVAVLFNPDTLEPVTEALVNIRSTLNKAVSDGVIDAEESDVLAKIASSLHFTERTYSNMFSKSQGSIDRQAVEKLKSYLASNRTDIKAEDALTLLQDVNKQYAKYVSAR